MVVSFSTIPFHKLMREAVVDLLTEYKQSAGLNLQIYPGRPMSIFVPSIFRDAQPEDQNAAGERMRQRNIHSQWIAIWGLFDSAEAAEQRDDFIDGFTAYVLDNFHKAHGASELFVGPVIDVPAFQPDWGSEAQRNMIYYATRITVEGFASG